MSGDEIQIGFWDFKSFLSFPHGFIGLGSSGQVPSEEGSGLRSKRNCQSLEQGWGNQFSVETAHITPRGMGFETRKSRSES